MHYEKTFLPSYLIGVEDGSTPLRNITLLALLSETNCLTNPVDGTRFPQREIDEIKTLAVVWNYNDDEIHVEQVYNQETGEVYWWDKPSEVWSDNDELLVSSLLMWGDLESIL